MRDVKVRTSFTSRGLLSLSTYVGNNSQYEIANINLGNNSNSKLEVVSLLNIFNIGHWNYHYNNQNSAKKYNPKLYLSAFQSMAPQWNYDEDSARKGELQGGQKSGSWPLIV